MTQNKTMPTDGNMSALHQKSDVDPIIGEAVGSQLRSLFDGLASEAVPDKFIGLIDQLERSEREKQAHPPENEGQDK